MLRILLPFAAGIILAVYFPFKSFIFVAFTVLFFVLLMVWYIYSGKRSSYEYRWVFGTLTAIFLLSTGYSIAILEQPGSSNSYYCRYLHESGDSLLVTIVSQPQEKEKTIKATAEVNAVMEDGKAIKTGGRALLYFQKDSLAGRIKYGDVLYLHARFQQVRPPSNPDEFDYKSYLFCHGIIRESYLRDNSWAFTNRNKAPWLLDFAARCRMKAVALLKEKVKGTEATLASAILLGYRDELPQPLIQQFADSGVIHVICVAGLHVGILFGLMAWILSPVEKIRGGKFIRLIITLMLLWFYALFTGLATSVLRATVMFSFLYAGRFFGRYSDSLNNLAVSAFLLLVCNPMSIADTGFQLSYLSVAGIIVLYPMFYRSIEVSNYFSDKIWELMCLSLSAQLAIAPLSIIYFHQFPNYFIFTNLLIVPLLALAICSGVLFFATSFIPMLSAITAMLLQKILMLMKLLVGVMRHLPFFATRGIAISLLELIVLYIILFALLAFALNKNKLYFSIALSGMALFLFGRIWREYNRCNQQLFAVYNIPGHSAVAFLSGKQGVLVQPVDSLDFCQHIQYNWWERGVTDSTTIGRATGGILLSNHLCFQANYAQFNTLQVAFIRNKEDIPHCGRKLRMNYLVISGGYKLDMATLQNAFIFDRLIFDSSVSNYRRKKWENECELLHIRYYDVEARGAFIQNLES